MYDFLRIKKEYNGKSKRWVYKPSFHVKPKIRDLMVKGRDFAAIFNPETNLWITDEAEAIELIDLQVEEEVKKEYDERTFSDKEFGPIIEKISDTDNKLIDKWHKFVQRDLRTTFHPLNQVVKFSDDKVTQNDFCTFKLSYPIHEGQTPYYDKLVKTLYLPDEAEKFEWALGCLLAGDQGKVQKMFLFYGTPGSGKSTIVEKVIVDTVLENSVYAKDFKAEDLVNGDSFGTAFLGDDPAFVFDLEAKLERIDNATTLNKLVSHEPVKVNDKFRSTYSVSPQALVVCCSNDTIQITPGKGMSRRIVDIRQTGITLPPDEYDECLEHLKFEKSGIAYHCLEVYKRRGKNFYNHYRPEDMMRMTSPFQNFVADNYLELKDGCTLVAAYDIYQEYAKDSNFKTVLSRYRFRDNLRLYFKNYSDGVFKDFKPEMIGIKTEEKDEKEAVKVVADSGWLKFNSTSSLFDKEFADAPAQEANDEGHPRVKWVNCKTTLKDIHTDKLHYVKPIDPTLVVVDLDIKGDDGKKNFERNYKEALKFPPTYAELSKSGEGIHLHYYYTGGKPEELSRVYSDNIEIKVFTGNASLRRMLTKCNDLPIATIGSGLPKQEEVKKMPTMEGFENERKLSNTIQKVLRREVSGCEHTKPAIDFIDKLLSDAYDSGKTYDVRNLLDKVLTLAMNSTNHSDYCVDKVLYMHFNSKDIEDTELAAARDSNRIFAPNAPIIFLDVDLFKNLFVVCWKYVGPDKVVVKEINPSPKAVQALFRYRIIGYNNRHYDNHLLWAAANGYSNIEKYKLSQKIINNEPNAKFGQAYNLSYTDIYDFAANEDKKRLKKWEIELQKSGKLVKHHENSIPWDQEVPKERWNEVADYCADDVLATEAVFNELQGSFRARQILVALANMFNSERR